MESYIELEINGKNIDNFIKRLNDNKINIYKLNKIDYKTIRILIKLEDFELVNKIKTIYLIKIINYKGLKRIKDIIVKNQYLIYSLIFGIVFFIVLINMIFEIDIVHNKKEIRNLISDNLTRYGLVKYRFKKSYAEVEEIEKLIIESNKDKIEWLEIEEVGVKYIVRVEERVISNTDDDNAIYDIVSHKDAIIKDIYADSGEIIKEINTYVKKGDTVISSNITFNENIKNIISAKGKIYGEVWYEVSVSYPLIYKEEILTGNKKDKYLIKLFNNYLEINKYKNRKIKENIIIKNDILPFSIVKAREYELKIINQKLDDKEALKYATLKARNLMNKKLKDKEYIIYEKCLKNSKKDSKMNIVVFYAVYEDITEYMKR